MLTLNFLFQYNTLESTWLNPFTVGALLYFDEVGDSQPWSSDRRRQLIVDVVMSIGVVEKPSILRLPPHIHS